MPDEHDYIQLNREQRERLTRLVETLSDTQLAQPLDGGGGWTVSAVLAHCAFWDRYALIHWETWEREGMKPLLVDVDGLNSAGFPSWLATPPRVAVTQAQQAAEAIDDKVENLDPTLVEKFLAEKYGL